MSAQKGHLIESDKRYSQSQIWVAQKTYFSTKGTDAWTREVPYYISSNVFIANRVAHLIVNALQDLVRKGHQGTINLIELGAGHGKFSFHFLKALDESLSILKLPLRIRYIMTDLAQKNIDFCRNNDSFKPYIENGVLDFARWDITTDEDPLLFIKGEPISKLEKDNPVLFISNYLFDVLPHDGFELDNAKRDIYEMQVSLESRFPNFKLEKLAKMNELKLRFSKKLIENTDYYQDPLWDGFLKDYALSVMPLTNFFVLPVTVMRFMQKCQSLFPKSIWFVGDKASATPEHLALSNISDFHKFDGCYSVTTNFHALGEWCHKLGGDYLPCQHNNIFKFSLFSLGMQLYDLPSAKHYFAQELESFGADEFCFIREEFALHHHKFSPEACLHFLKLSGYDPDTYFFMHDKLVESLPNLSQAMRLEFIKALKKVEDNIYQYQSFSDVYSLLGSFYMSAKMDQRAEELFNKALNAARSPFLALRALGILYERKGNTSKAFDYYKKALSHRPSDQFTIDKIRKIEGHPLATAKPLLRALFVFSLVMALIYLSLIKF
jgi:tetratricopeptide (TPR) repeat protein